MNARLTAYLAHVAEMQKNHPMKPSEPDDRCAECNGRGKLTVLGGDWGKTPESERECWMCKGTGVQA